MNKYLAVIFFLLAALFISDYFVFRYLSLTYWANNVSWIEIILFNGLLKGAIN
jgi:hypothetical protein